MIVPHHQLSKEALQNLVEQFVLREGTDYGDQEYSLAAKVDDVLSQLDSGEAIIVYSEEYETVDIRPSSEFKTSQL
jgi:uncharacterized protein YheU (UPF0270 family)